MSFSLPPIVKLAERLLVDIEQAVRSFARYHKYAIGADLRREAMKVVRYTHRAWRQRAAQLDWTRRVVKVVRKLHAGKVTAHWLWVALSRVAAGEDVEQVMRDYGWERKP